MKQCEQEAIELLFDAATRWQPYGIACNKVAQSFQTANGAVAAHVLEMDQTYYKHAGLEGLSILDPGMLQVLISGHDHLMYTSPIVQAFPELLRVNKAEVAFNSEIIGAQTWRECDFFQRFCYRKLDLTEVQGHYLRERNGRMRWGVFTGHPKAMVRRARKSRKFAQWLTRLAGQVLQNVELWQPLTSQAVSAEALLLQSTEALVAIRGKKLLLATPTASKLLGLDLKREATSFILKDLLDAVSATSSHEPKILKAADGSPFTLHTLNHLVDGTPIILARLISSVKAAPASTILQAGRLKGLTQRESQVISLVSRGLSDMEVARDLKMAYNTARCHLRNIYAKLEVSGRIEAINKLADTNRFP